MEQPPSTTPSAGPGSVPAVPPAAALAALLPADVDLATGAGLRHEAARPVWYGMVWSRLGRGELAWAHWDRVRLPALQPWIAAERGRVLRELGLHRRAEALEWPALLAADDAVDAAMLRVSLTADAVGTGDRERAHRRLQAAARAVAELPDGPRAARQRLRLAWVRVEVAALLGEPLPGEGLPVWDADAQAPVQPPDAAWGTGFHAAKGLLFGGLVSGDLRLLDAAARLAPPVLKWAVHLARAEACDDPAAATTAATAAAAAWQVVVPPCDHAGEVADTTTARRLRAPRDPG
ncbi:hypothetical protein [Egicoccus halophilus]|uniref:Uncharacterized protein n=1 Tax=Egicoccus halophilus TaxID=1670830 RepID=A0A8J3A803_9ACTN|nr:hypothetical protein [Egicoccus halophilus]GGI05929.1 hypothetical protein GCM10011354_16560 [Egicoccus halophilus]